MNSDDLSLSSLSNDEIKIEEQELSRSRSKEHRHKHKKKHKRHSHKHKHRHKSSSRKERKHKKHRCKHRHKESESESAESVNEDVELIDELLESGLEAIVSNHNQPKDRERDVEIMQASAGNGIVESMKIVVDNRNGSREQPLTVSSSEEDGMDQLVSDENSREASRRAEEFCLDSSDFLPIHEDLNLEELMKQKAALQACLGAYMSDVEEEEENQEIKQKPVVVQKAANEVVTIDDSDEAEPKKKERRKERESRPKKRKRSRLSMELIQHQLCPVYSGVKK